MNFHMLDTFGEMNIQMKNRILPVLRSPLIHLLVFNTTSTHQE